jgi:diguanylate cyclase (GGDEF)-like protein
MKHSIVKKILVWVSVSILISLTPFIVISISEISELKTVIPKDQYQEYYLILLAGCVYMIFILSIVLSSIIKRLVLNQIGKHLTAFKKASDGDLLIRLSPETKDEFGELSIHFNKLMEKLTDLKAGILDKEQAIKWAEREASLKEMLEKKSKELTEVNRNLENRLAERSLLLDIINEISSTIDLKEVLNNICKMVSSRMDIDEMCILLNDDSGNSLIIKAAYGMKEPEKIINLLFKKGEGVAGYVLSTGEAYYIKDVSNEPRFLQFKGRYKAEGSMLVLPVWSQKKLIGVITFLRRNIDGFSSVDIQLLKIIASQAAMAIQNAQMYSRTRDMAIHDPLTSLYNRRYLSHKLIQEIERARRFQSPVSLLMIDVDNFKIHNDRLGHLVGDEILKRIAQLLIKNVRRIDTVVRYGGEEFCIILPGTGLNEGTEVAEKIRTFAEKTSFYHLPPICKTLPITLSIGVASLTETMKSGEDLINTADKCLLKAKELGKNRVVSTV